jgi:quercetin dioxygenase-like cupin family protein
MTSSKPEPGFVFDEGDLPTKRLFKGVTAALAWGEKIMLSVVRLEPGSLVPEHAHPHEQAGVCLQGQFELTVAGEACIIHAGELYIIPGNTPHAARGLDAPCKTLDIFAPPREEYKS